MMCDMLVEQRNSMGSLGGSLNRASEMGPRSPRPGSANGSILHDSQSKGHNDIEESNKDTVSSNISPLQRLQYAIESNSVFSNLFGNQPDGRIQISSPELTTNVVISHRNPALEEFESMEGDMDESDMRETTEPEVSSVGSDKMDGNKDEGNNNVPGVFQCPLCSKECNSRHHFNEHLVTHSQQLSCPKCTYLTCNDEELQQHLQDAHDGSDLEKESLEDESRHPKVNSQGKLKIFKCKQCNYKTVTKQEFWEHSKSHIRSEKMLTCPKCPFVTEYKHHLEYHLRNHFGSKPFQCNKCSYSCVNKSMLNSHLKSHSNVYQYRCADCSYATKYCHSLKLHLRKYTHKPAMVLNPDGTPNPLPIIDVYGTRRGPKMKRSEPLESGCTTPATSMSPVEDGRKTKSSKSSNKSSMRADRTNATSISPSLERKRPHTSPSQMAPISPPESNESPTDRSSQLITPPPAKRGMMHDLHDGSITMTLPDSPISPASAHPAVPHQAIALQKTLMTGPNIVNMLPKNSLQLYAAALNQYLFTNSHLVHLVQPPQPDSPTDLSRSLHLPRCEPNLKINEQFHDTLSASRHAATPLKANNAEGFPLDLRNPGGGELKDRRKRKGKALKYEKAEEHSATFGSARYEDCYNNNNNNAPLDFSNGDYGKEVKKDVDHRRNGEQVYAKKSAPVSCDKELLMCKYCEISFPDHVLYAMHMNYHSGEMEPFRCKVCGKKTTDKTSFFIHLTTDSH